MVLNTLRNPRAARHPLPVKTSRAADGDILLETFA